MEDKNYYMNEEIGNSGVASTRNPIYSFKEYQPFEVSPRRINVGDIITPISRHDEFIGNLDPVRYGETTVDDLRAEQQSNIGILGNALANNIVIAGTTAIGGTLGLVDGIFSAINEKSFDKIWDNDVTNWVTDIQERTSEALPIYRGENYKNKSLFQKMGTGIFWGDLIQNLGFAEGMLLQGAGMAKTLTNAPSIVRALVPSLTASIGEASIEAVNTRKDEETNKVRMANEEYNRKAAEAKTSFALGVLDSEYNKTLDSIEHDARVAGNFVFGSNVALLTASNALQFGNLFSRGFGTAKRIKGALNRTGTTYTADNLGAALLKTGGKKLADAASEGLEEVSQGVISATPSNYLDYNTFNESMFNPEKRELVTNIWQALGESYSQAFKDPETGVEFATGFLIGALGIPTIKKRAFPIGIENNIGVELYDTYRTIQRQRELADNINNRLQEDKKINSYYNGLVRHLTIQDSMNAALDASDAFDYKNAESAQFISDIMMFDDAGDINNLKDIINNSIDMSDEGIDNIIQETSTNGNGPFMMNGNAINRDEVRRILKEKIDILNSKIDNYVKDKEYLEGSYPEASSETIANALFLKAQYTNNTNRYNDLLSDTYKQLSEALQSLPREGDFQMPLSKVEFDLSIKTNPSFVEGLSNIIFDKNVPLSYDVKTSLKTNLGDLVKLKNSIIELNNSLEDILINPSRSTEKLQETVNKVEDTHNQKITENLQTNLGGVTTLGEFRAVINSDESTLDLKQKVVNDLANNGNELAKDYKETTAYYNSVLRSINDSSESSETKENAIKLLNSLRDYSNNIIELSNINSVAIDDPAILYDDSLTEEDNYNREVAAKFLLQSSMNQVNSERGIKEVVSKGYIPPVSEESSEESEVSEEPRVTTYEPPTGNVSNGQIMDENSQLNDRVETPEDLDKKQQGKIQYYRPVIPELHIEASKRGDFRPFNEVVKEREGKDFDLIYNYLKNNGAFTYVNEGNLKPGDELGFMIDPEFEASVAGESWHTSPTIFIIDKRNNQIVGSLDESSYSVDRYEGLQELRDKIIQEYNQRISESQNNSTEIELQKFVATPTTRVSKVMIGKIPYGLQERNLANIPNVSGEGSNPIFGIVRNGTLVTNGGTRNREFIKPMDIAHKEGRLYLLIPNAAGKYSPAAVRVKHFNKREFNPEDVEVQNTQVYKNIQEAIEELTRVTNAEELKSAVGTLKSHLYLGNLHIDWFTSKNGNGIRFTKVQRDSFGNEIYEEVGGQRRRKEQVYTVVVATDLSSDPNYVGSLGGDGSSLVFEDPGKVSSRITDILLNMNLPIQVNIGMINNGGYNNMLINSGVLTSNITDARVVSSWFTTDYIDKSGTPQKAVNPTNNNPISDTDVSPVGGYNSVTTEEQSESPVRSKVNPEKDLKEKEDLSNIVQKEWEINPHDEEFEDDLELLRGSNEYTYEDFDNAGQELYREYSIKELRNLLNLTGYNLNLFNGLLGIAEKFNIKVQFIPKGKDILGAYGYKNIYIYVPINSPEFTRVLLHETIHAVTHQLFSYRGTDRLTEEQNEAFNIIEGVYNTVKERYPKADYYGLNSLSEFISELANPAFREFLENERIDNNTSLWTRVIEFFKKLLGNNALIISESSLEELIANPIIDARSFRPKNLKARAKRSVLNSNLSSNEKRYIKSYIINLLEHRKIDTEGNTIIYNPNTRTFYEVNYPISIESMEENKGGDGFEVIHKTSLHRDYIYEELALVPETIQEKLINKKWTSDKFDSISQEERDKAIECLLS